MTRTETRLDTDQLAEDLYNYVQEHIEDRLKDLVKRFEIQPYNEEDRDLKYLVIVVLNEAPPDNRTDYPRFVEEKISYLEDVIYDYFRGKANYKTLYGLDRI
jgi:hypothetical protein